MMTITYPVKNGLYVNMTNRCPCACTFCLRQNADSVYGSEPLWLDREPTVEEVCADMDRRDLSQYDEVVFCGYGEPTERFDDMMKIAEHIHTKYNKRVRLNTNGLGSLINGRDIVPEMVGRIDRISISLNAPNAERYDEVCRSRFGKDAFPAILDFIKECRERIPGVTVSVVSGFISQAEEDECERMARSMNVAFRSR